MKSTFTRYWMPPIHSPAQAMTIPLHPKGLRGKNAQTVSKLQCQVNKYIWYIVCSCF